MIAPHRNADDECGSERHGTFSCGSLISLSKNCPCLRMLREDLTQRTRHLHTKYHHFKENLGDDGKGGLIRYLHRTALDTAAYANKMLNAGHFVIQEHSHLPTDVLSTLARHPPETTSSPPSKSMDIETTPWHVAKSIIG